MKRTNPTDSPQNPPTLKKLKPQPQPEPEPEPGFSKLDDNLLYEIFKHADARTLAVASTVSKSWNRTALDERLWELIYTRRCSHLNSATQLRSVVLALGGFRRLHALYFSKPPPPPSTGWWSGSAAAAVSSTSKSKVAKNTRWGKDEVNLSLSLLSIKFYEKMSNSGADRKSN